LHPKRAFSAFRGGSARRLTRGFGLYLTLLGYDPCERKECCAHHDNSESIRDGSNDLMAGRITGHDNAAFADRGESALPQSDDTRATGHRSVEDIPFLSDVESIEPALPAGGSGLGTSNVTKRRHISLQKESEE
jgi:hypothetical protein